MKEPVEATPSGTAEGDAFDPILSQVVHNHELTVNREMGQAVVNLSGSFLFVSASDFATGCLDADGNILTTVAWSLQMGYAISNTVRAALARFEIGPGDVIFCNDPYDGGGLHSHDVVVVAPVFTGDTLVMWVGVCAHISDVGGSEVGGYAVEPCDVYAENLRFTPVRIYEGGRFRSDILDAFLTNVRVPGQVAIDIKALMGAVWIGRERMADFIDQYGVDVVRSIHASQIRQSERALRERLLTLPDGVYEGAAHMEHDGASDRIYTIRARLVKEGDSLTVDWSDTDPQAPGVLNCAKVGSVGNVIAALGTIIAPDIPFNEGLLNPVTITSPPGTLVNAIKPAPISGATVYAAWFGTDAILEAANYLIAGGESTEHRRTGPWGSWTFAWLQSLNQYGNPWFWNVFTGGSGGAGAMPFRDGENAMMGIQTIDAFTPNIEDYELQSPALFISRRYARDTGGAGKFRGGLALESLCGPYDVGGWDVTVFQNRRGAPSSAVSGGYPGAGAAIRFARGAFDDVRRRWDAGDTLPLDEYAETAEQPPTRGKGFRVAASDLYYMRATGGPGYGDPLSRDVSDVAGDVASGYVSEKTAREAYGVVCYGDGVVVAEATQELRRQLRADRLLWPFGYQVLGTAADAADPGPLQPAQAQTLGELLAIDGDGNYFCRNCGQELSSNAVNWKWHARVAEDVVSPEAIHASIHARPERDVMFRRYCCPACGVLIDTEVALRDEAPRWNYRPLKVWRESNPHSEAPTP